MVRGPALAGTAKKGEPLALGKLDRTDNLIAIVALLIAFVYRAFAVLAVGHHGYGVGLAQVQTPGY